jgi:hypothetical protein
VTEGEDELDVEKAYWGIHPGLHPPFFGETFTVFTEVVL